MLMSLSVSGCQLLISFNGVAEMSTQCSDGIDNDQNGFMDCADPSCEGSEQCGGGRDGGSPVDASSTMDGFTRDGSLQDAGVADGASGNTSVVQSLTGPNGIVCTTVPLPVQANSSAALNFGLPSPGQGVHRSMSSLADGTVAVAQVEASQRLVLHHRFVSGMKSSSVVADVDAASPSVVAIPGTRGGSTIVWTQVGIIRTLSSLTP
jgi:hypothetical protein